MKKEKQKCYQPNLSDIVYENFGDEVVIINLKSGIYFSLTDTALVIWNFIVKKICMDELIRYLSGKYNEDQVNMENKIRPFITGLEKDFLIVPVDRDSTKRNVDMLGKSSLNSSEKESFTTPVLKRFTDQQELLLLDPIHDVSDLGWPEKNQLEPDEK
jgi:hypothetical protein